MLVAFLVVVAGVVSSLAGGFDDAVCPEGCLCDDSHTLFCNDVPIQRVPVQWPTHFRKIILRNTSLTALHKSAFRKFHSLEELRIEDNGILGHIEKYAFKGLHKLRQLSVERNTKLREIVKSAFSGISNENLLKIRLVGNGISVVRSHAFKNLNNIRELSIDDRCVRFERHSLGAVSKLDFLTLRGVCSLEAGTFENTTRIHSLRIEDSTFNLSSNVFDGLSHVNQILMQGNRIDKIDTGAFAGSSTVGSLQLQTNKIGAIEPRAFDGTENLGTVTLTQNTINSPLESAECIASEAQNFVFSDNTVYCSCPLRWVKDYPDRSVLKENFCGREEAFRALLYFEPRGCPTPAPSSSPKSPASNAMTTTLATTRRLQEPAKRVLNAAFSPTMSMSLTAKILVFFLIGGFGFGF